MSLHLLGAGWVTPLGRSLDSVWSAIQAGTKPTATSLLNPFTNHAHPAYLVDPADLTDTARLRRLRRSSTISHLAVTAALDAVANAAITLPPNRTALIFAATNGGVIYTRKFFAELAESNASAGSPILFPETVYNAPASHVAETLGITATTSTIVGDAATGLNAIRFADDLLATNACDVAIVVAAEEADWIISEAYSLWNLTGPDGATFAEGAAALVLARDQPGHPVLETHPGMSPAPHQATNALTEIIADLFPTSPPTHIISSANNSPFDTAEARALAQAAPTATTITPKLSLGESFAPATLAQVICASLLLQTHPTAQILVAALGATAQTSALKMAAS